MHVSCDAPKASTVRTSKVEKERNALVLLLNKEPLHHSEFVAKVMIECGIKQRAAKERISDLVTAKLVIKNDVGLYEPLTVTSKRWIDDNE
jgi:hypothetical protein